MTKPRALGGSAPAKIERWVTVHSALLCVALTGQRTSPAACSEGVALGYDVTALRADRSGRLVMARQRRVLTAKRGIAVSWRLLRGKFPAGTERRKPSGADPAVTHRQRQSPQA